MKQNINKIIWAVMMVITTVSSTIPAVNVIAAETLPSGNDIVSQYEIDLYKYGSELLRNTNPEFESIDNAQIDAIKDFYIDGNYVRTEDYRQITYDQDGNEKFRYEYEYDPATGKLSKCSYISSVEDDSHYTVYEYLTDPVIVLERDYDSMNSLTGYSKYYYDNLGNVTDYYHYKPDDTIDSYSTYERTFYDNPYYPNYYQKTYSYKSYELIDGYFAQIGGFDYEYGRYNNIIGKTYYEYDYSGHELYESERYEYIDGSYSEKRMNHYTNGELDYYETYEPFYYGRGSETISVIHSWNADGSKKSTCKYSYLTSGLFCYLVETQFLDENDTIIKRYVNELDSFAEVVSETYYEDEIIKEKIEYDETHRKKQLTRYSDEGTLFERTVYEYIENEFFSNDHYVPNFAAYNAPDGCVFNYRLYNPNNGEHFYTGSQEETKHLVELGWNFEGPGFVNPIDGESVYRLYNSDKSDHIYTMDEEEINDLLSEGWTFDGGTWAPAFPSASEEIGKPMFRLYNPNAWDNEESGAFHFTMSEEEKDKLVNIGWQYQGIGWYSV